MQKKKKGYIVQKAIDNGVCEPEPLSIKIVEPIADIEYLKKTNPDISPFSKRRAEDILIRINRIGGKKDNDHKINFGIKDYLK